MQEAPHESAPFLSSEIDGEVSKKKKKNRKRVREKGIFLSPF